jgi:hypothetical protein
MVPQLAIAITQVVKPQFSTPLMVAQHGLRNQAE